MDIFGHYNYWISIALMMLGFYTVISRTNMVKKLIGLNVFQTAVFLLYITMGKITGGTAPILMHGAAGQGAVYSNPLPHVLILTAIVVSVATTSVGLAIVVRIRRAYGTVEEDDVVAQDLAQETGSTVQPEGEQSA